jgi:hypothetical protein
VPAAGGLERSQPFGHDFVADDVAGNHRDPVLFHRRLSSSMSVYVREAKMIQTIESCR